MLTEQQKLQALTNAGYSPSDYRMDDDWNVFKIDKEQPAVGTNEVLTKPESQGPTQDSSLETFGKSFLNAAPSTIASGAAAGVGVSSAPWIAGSLGLAPETGGASLLGLLVPILAGLGTGYGVSKLQKAVVPDSIQKNVAASQATNPTAANLGALATLPLGGFNPSPTSAIKGAGTLGKLAIGMQATEPELANLTNVGVGTGVGAATGVAQNVLDGQPIDIKSILENAVVGGLFNKPNAIGNALGFHSTPPDISSLIKQNALDGSEGLPQIRQASVEQPALQTKPPLRPIDVLRGVSTADVGLSMQKYDKAGNPITQKELITPRKNAQSSAADIDMLTRDNASVEDRSSVIADYQKQIEYERMLNEKAQQDLRDKLNAQQEINRQNEADKQSELAATGMDIKNALNNSIARPEVRPEPLATTPLGRDIPKDFTGVTEQNNKEVQNESPADLEARRQEGLSDRYQTPIERTEFEKQMMDKARASGLPDKPTKNLFDLLNSWFQQKRGVGLRLSDKIKGLGETSVPTDAKSSILGYLSHINPNKAGVDTLFHEPFHVFYNRLKYSDRPSDQRLVSKFEKLVSNLPEYQQKFGNDPHGVEEYITSNQGWEAVRRHILNDEGGLKSYFKDVLSYIKTRYSDKVSEADFRRILDYRFANDPVWTKQHGSQLSGGVVGNRNQDERLDKDGYYATVQHDNEVPGSGYVQMDEVKGGKNIRSFSPEQATKEGLKLPDRASLKLLEQGKHYLGDGLETRKQDDRQTRPDDESVKQALANLVKGTDDASISAEHADELTRALIEQVDWKKAPEVKHLLEQPNFDNLDPDVWSTIQKVYDNAMGKRVTVKEIKPQTTEQSAPKNEIKNESIKTQKVAQTDAPASKEVPGKYDNYVKDLLKSRWEQVNKEYQEAEKSGDKKLMANKQEELRHITEIAKTRFQDDRVTDKLKEIRNSKDWPLLTPEQGGFRARLNELPAQDVVDYIKSVITPEQYDKYLSYRATDETGKQASLDIKQNELASTYFRRIDTPLSELLDSFPNIKKKLNADLNMDGYGPKDLSDEQKEKQFQDWYKSSKKGLRLQEERLPREGEGKTPYPFTLKELNKGTAIEDMHMAHANDTDFTPIQKEQMESYLNPERNQKDRKSFASFLTARYDKIAEKFSDNPLAKYVTDKLHSFEGESEFQKGQIGNKLIQSLKGYNEKSIERVYRHQHQIDDTGKSTINLTPNEQKLADRITEILKEPRKTQIAKGLQVKAGNKNFRTAGIKPEGYMFNELDTHIANEWAERPDSLKSRQYDKLFIDHQVSHGASPEEAKTTLIDYKNALGNRDSKDVEFGALRKAEGKGLPWELVDKNFVSAASRYSNRAARDLAYFTHIQSDPKMRNALNIKDQFGNRPAPEDVSPISNSKEVKDAMRSVNGLSSVPQTPRVNALARAVASTIMGPGTAVRNVLNIPSFISNYVQNSQLPLAFKALSNINASKVRAFESNAVRQSFNDYDAAGYYMGNPDPVIRVLDKYSSFMRKYQGRDFSDKFEGQYFYSLGELLATDNIAKAKNGDKTATKWLDRFGDIVEGGGDKLIKGQVSQEDIQRVAKRFVDATRGTYGAEGLPSFALEGHLAPFTSLSRFGIEKSNTIYKDVINPLKEGNIRPLLAYTLSSLGVGIATEKLNELLSNKRGNDPTLKEAMASQKPEEMFAKAVGLLQLSTFAGVVSDGAKLATDAALGRANVKQNTLSFPLYDFVTDTIGSNVMQAADAVKHGEDPFEVMAKLAQVISTSSVQSMRYVNNNFIEPKEAKRKEAFRDLSVYEKMEGIDGGSSSSSPDEFQNLGAKDFKETNDIHEAATELPNLISKALKQSTSEDGIDIEKLRSKLDNIKQNNYQTMPSPDAMPKRFMDYLNYLRRTQGNAAAEERLLNYFKQRAVNQVKSEMVPSV